MTHDTYPSNPNVAQNSEPANTEYQDYPVDHQLQRVAVQHAPQEGQSVGSIEHGWLAVGEHRLEGNDYVKVVKFGNDGTHREGFVAKNDLMALQDKLAAERARVIRDAAEGKVAVAAATGRLDDAREPFIEPKDHQTLTPEQARALRAQSEQAPTIENVVTQSHEGMIDALLSGFTETDRLTLRDFADAAADKRQAQRDGSNEGSLYSSSEMGSSFRAMSPTARAQARSIAQRIYGASEVAF